MRETRLSGSEGGGTEFNRFSLPLSKGHGARAGGPGRGTLRLRSPRLRSLRLRSGPSAGQAGQVASPVQKATARGRVAQGEASPRPYKVPSGFFL